MLGLEEQPKILFNQIQSNSRKPLLPIFYSGLKWLSSKLTHDNTSQGGAVPVQNCREKTKPEPAFCSAWLWSSVVSVKAEPEREAACL